jgi:predicted HTH transcriptional regulator
MLDTGQLNDTDEQILEFMTAYGRVTPSWVADETDNPRAYVSQRLKRLKEHDHVSQPYRGLWDLETDPRKEGSDNE